MNAELNELQNVIKNKKIVIYGAGEWASFFYVYLDLLGLSSNVVFVTVTEGYSPDSSVFKRDIVVYNEIKNDIRDCLIVVAIRSVGELMESITREHKGDIYRLTSLEMYYIREYVFSYYSNLNHPIQRNKIFINHYDGKNGYCCNGKYIVEKLMKESYPVEIVWNAPDHTRWQFPEGVKTVAQFSSEYFQDVSTAGIVICNTDVPSHKRKEQYVINTWHGTGPFKKVGASQFEGDMDICAYYENMFSKVDVFLSNSADNTEMFRESFLYDGEIYESGSPRNDILFQENKIREQICRKFGIESNKKILLYAPTFRGGGWKETGRGNSFVWYDLDMEDVLESLSKKFGKEIVLMYRFHHRLYEYIPMDDFYPGGIDVTFYPDVMELLVAADVLITDYSSVMWDFSLQRRPVFLYHNDEREYTDDRGFYWPVSRWPYPKAHTCEELCQVIEQFDEEEYLEGLEAFFEADPSYDDGHASERAVERIMDVIHHPEKYGKA